MQISPKGTQSLRIVVAGGSGFIGRELVHSLQQQGHTVLTLVRDRTLLDSKNIYWNPDLNIIDFEKLEHCDVVINLVGKKIAGKRWSEKSKTEFKDSRIKATQLLAHTISRLKKPPRLFLSASATGYYGDRGSEVLGETAKPGMGFLSQLCREWELATWEAEAIGVTANHLRFGVVLSPDGGALKEMLLSFRLGLSAILGSGEQYFPWVTRSDAIRAIIFLIEHPQPSGPFNVVAPQPVTNKEFTKTLAKALHRPSFLKLSASFIRFLFGEMGDSLLLSSTRAMPENLTKAGFEFSSKDLASALEMLRK